MKKNKFEIDMCNGSIMDKLISFSLPLMLTSILQLMFNAVDIIVVGRFSGSQALAAVGSTTALINIFTNLFIGISLGANVLAARYYAAGRDKEMSEAVHTAIALAFVSGNIMAFVGVGASRFALELMDTPADVIDQSVLYMRIYFMGMPFFMLLHSLVTSALPYIFYTTSISRIDAGIASILAASEPAAAMLFGFLFFRETPSALSVAGLFLTTGAIIALSRSQTKGQIHS